mmetsp:Transcript_8565/g.19842  ORF Transcript_8565/g.19842 Transcript_8565/m.19842 type:complete len:102 (+) Transcript_8565:701-1006(+)
MDGYITILNFRPGELGTVYNLPETEMIIDSKEKQKPQITDSPTTKRSVPLAVSPSPQKRVQFETNSETDEPRPVAVLEPRKKKKRVIPTLVSTNGQATLCK